MLVVARDALGTINHTLLTVREARRQGLEVRGVVLNCLREDDGRGLGNREALEAFTGLPIWTFPYLRDRARHALARAAAALGWER